MANRANHGNKFKNGGRQFFINLITARIVEYGFGRAHNTSMIQSIMFNKAMKKLYNPKNGAIILNIVAKALSIVFAKSSRLGDISKNPGNVIFKAFKKSNIDSGKPSGSSNPGTGIVIGENGEPKPGNAIPGIPPTPILLSEGLQGIVSLYFYRSISFNASLSDTFKEINHFSFKV